MHDNIEPCSIVHGGRSVRGYKIVCGKCNAVEQLPYNYTKGPIDNDITERKVEHNFECRGWKIGKRQRDNRCPDCIKRANDMRYLHAGKSKANGHKPTKDDPVVDPIPLKYDKTEPLLQSDKTELKASTVIPKVWAASGTISAMSRLDRQAITAKLFDVYGDETTGYKANWDDQKVATDMAVPVEWVAEIRDQTFGPPITINTVELAEWKKGMDRLNEMIANFERDQKAISQEFKDTQTKLSNSQATFNEESKRLRNEANRLLAKAQDIERKINR